jgi:hypothetical protein
MSEDLMTLPELQAVLRRVYTDLQAVVDQLANTNVDLCRLRRQVGVPVEAPTPKEKQEKEKQP